MKQKDTEQTRVRHPGWIRRMMKGVGWGAIALVFLAMNVVLLFQFQSVRESTRNFLIRQLKTVLNADITLDGFSMTLLEGVILERLRLSNASGDIIRMERLSIGYSLPLIFGNHILVSSARIQGLELRIISFEDGSTNFSNLAASASDDPGTGAADRPIPHIIIGNFNIEHGRIIIKDHGDTGEGRPEIRIARLASRCSYDGVIRLEVRDSEVGINIPHYPRLTLKGQAAFHPENLKLILSGVDILSDASLLKVSGEMDFSGETTAFDGRITCGPFNLADLKAGLKLSGKAEGEVRGNIAVKGHFSRFSHEATLVLNETAFTSAGTVGFEVTDEIDFDTHGTARHVNPANIPFLSTGGEAYDLNADFQVKGRYRPTQHKLEGLLALDVLPSKSPWIEVEKGRILLDFFENKATLSNVRLKTPKGPVQIEASLQRVETDLFLRDAVLSGGPLGHVRVEGEILRCFSTGSEKRLKVKSSGSQIDLHPFYPHKAMAGDINLDLNLEAQLPPDFDIRNARSRFMINLRPSRMSGISVVSGSLNAAWKPNQLFIESLDLDTGLGRVRAGGEVFPFDRKGRFSADADIGDLRALNHTLLLHFPDLPLDPEIGGAVRVEAAIAGSLESQTFSLNLTGQQLGTKEFRARSVHLTGKGEGSLKLLEGDIDLSLGLTHESGNGLSLRGKINAAREGRGRAAFDTLSFDSPKIPLLDGLANQGPIRLQWSRDALVVDAFKMRSQGAVLSLGGELKKGERQDFRVELSNFDLSHLAPFPESHRNLSGTVSVAATLSGTMNAPMIAAKIAGKNLSGYQMSGADLTGDLTYADSSARVSVLLSKQGNKFFSAKGTVGTTLQFLPFRSDISKSKIDFTVQSAGLRISDFPLPKSREITFDASAAADIRVTGRTDIPDIKGNIKLTDGYVSLPKNGLTYETMTAYISFVGEKLEVQDVLLSGDKEGYIRGSGTVHLKGGIPDQIDLTLTGEDFFVPYRKAITARVTPRLRLTGSPASPVLSGEVTLRESKINLDVMAGPSVPEIRIIESDADVKAERKVIVEEPPSELMNALAADVLVKAPKNAWLKGQNINAEISGEIGLHKEAGKGFVFLGDLNAIRGTYYFRGRHFRIEKGLVAFIGLEDPNPNIDITASSRIQDVDILVHLTGTGRKLVLTLDSDPRMDQSDIISYLVFGKPTDSLKGGQAFNAEKAAMRFSGGLLATELRGIMGDMFFFDAFAVESGDNGGGVVSVGKYIRPNLFVNYRHGLAQNESSQVEISYEFNRNIRVETQLGNERNSGVDLFWQLDF